MYRLILGVLCGMAWSVVAGLGPTALAAPQPYKLDKSHAFVTFTVSHFGFSDVHGLFQEFDADIMYDPDDVAASSVVLTIDAASVFTNWERRDNHIRNSDFLDVDFFPEIVFTSTRIESTGDTTAKLYGDLTMRDETHEEVFDITLTKVGELFDNEVVGFRATGVVERTKYGMEFGAPGISAEVPVVVTLEMSPE